VSTRINIDADSTVQFIGPWSRWKPLRPNSEAYHLDGQTGNIAHSTAASS